MWYLNDVVIESLEDILIEEPKCIGFIYLITNKLNNKQYVGKKLLRFKKTKQVKNKKKSILVESDWQTYWSSSDEVKSDVFKYGEENFKREILNLCISKSQLSYWESKWQFQLDVLLYPDKFYNGWISCRIRRAHLLTKSLTKNET